MDGHSQQPLPDLLFPSAACIGQQSNVARPLDLSGKSALMLGTCASLPARPYLAFFGGEPSQKRCVLVIDFLCFIGTKLAESGFGNISP